MTAISDPASIIQWAVRGRPIEGCPESGDLHIVAPFQGGALVGIIDGLGHGPEAAVAARAGVDALRLDPAQPVLQLIEDCHRAVRATRGLVLSLASIDAIRGEVSWAGVGNVEAVIFPPGKDRPLDRIVPRSGVVGYRLPPMRAVTLPIAPGSTIVFGSDGLRHDFVDQAVVDDLGSAADYLLETFGKTDDDATVLLVRYLGLRS